MDTLAWSTVALAIATTVLAGLALVSIHQAKKQIRFAAQQNQIQGNVALLDHLRRRGEATMLALKAFLADNKKIHAELLAEAREVPDRSITEMLESTPSKATKGSNLMQQQIDAVEFLAVGIRTGIYDLSVTNAVAKSALLELWVCSTGMVNAIRDGRMEHRPKAQRSAYEHFDWLYGELKKLNPDSPVLLGGQWSDMSALGSLERIQDVQLSLSRLTKPTDIADYANGPSR